MTSRDSSRHSRSPYRVAARVGSRRIRAFLAAGTVAAVAAAIAVPMTGFSSAATRKNLVKNPGFERGLAAWAPAQAGRTITVTGKAHSGTSAALLTTSVTGVMSVRDRPNTVRSTPKDARYRASAWVKANRPGLDVSLRIREVRQDRVPGTHTRVLVRKDTADLRLADTGWHQLVLDYTAAPGHQLDVGVFAWNATPAHALYVDDVRLVQLETAAPTSRPSQSSRPNEVSPAPSTPAPSEPTRPAPTSAPTTSAPTTPAAPTTPVAPIPVSDTLFGTATEQGPGETFTQAISRRDRELGRAKVLRVFYPALPQAWPGRAGQVERDVVVSFKANPRDVISGAHDAQLRDWFASAPRDRQIFWTYYHEPEDNITAGEFTAAQYRAAWKHLASLADTADNPRLKATLILMAWSTKKASGRDWRDYYAGPDVIDVLGWDAYNTAASGSSPRYADVSEIYAGPAAISKAEGKPFGFAEWGSLLLPGDDGSRRAAWIRESTRYIAELGATFATYFDSTVGGDFRLTDAASQQALRAAIESSR